MTHGEFLLLFEAATAGWHGAHAQAAMLSSRENQAFITDPVELAGYHARLAARAALRAIHALDVEEDRLEVLR